MGHAEERIAQILAEYTQRIIAEVKSELTDRVMAALAGTPPPRSSLTPVVLAERPMSLGAVDGSELVQFAEQSLYAHRESFRARFST